MCEAAGCFTLRGSGLCQLKHPASCSPLSKALNPEVPGSVARTTPRGAGVVSPAETRRRSTQNTKQKRRYALSVNETLGSLNLQESASLQSFYHQICWFSAQKCSDLIIKSELMKKNLLQNDYLKGLSEEDHQIQTLSNKNPSECEKRPSNSGAEATLK